ncbi:MAG: Mpo1-like protein [Terriglobales bacterium]
MNSVKAFIIDYCQRHAHPVNACLHIIGVPAAFYGIYLLFAGKLALAAVLIFIGYLFQYLGHRAQGNEVGEVTLIKHLWRRLHANRGG